MQAAYPDSAAGMRPVRIPLSVNDPNAGRSLTQSVDRMLRDGGGRAPVVVELHGTHLPAPLVAALIGNLRRLRAAGIELTANPTTLAMRTAMAVHGLDRVFGSHADGRAGVPPRRSAVRDTAWPVFALLLLMATIATVMVLLQASSGYGGI